MTNAELIACIQAEERGEVVEYKHALSDDAKWIIKEPSTRWDSYEFEYRIKPREPRKCWVTWRGDGTPCVMRHSGSPTENVCGWQLVVEDVK